MFKRSIKFTGILFLVLAVSSGILLAQGPETPAESTNFQSGPTMYDDLMNYVYDLESKSELMNVQKVTETLMGRDVVLCILSNPAVYKASDAVNGDKPIVLIVNNVHGGEVAGKDATLILMRDLLFRDLRALLDDVIVLIIPTINPDGAEAGRRTNEQGFDMNRDYLKLETQEIHALVTKVINRWQPDLHIDTHHGGSEPYVITYQTNMNPAGDKELMRLGNEVILPRMRQALRAENYDGFWYSGPRFEGGEPVSWGPTSVEPRKQHVYSTLANMVGFLFETPRGGFRVINNGTEVVAIPNEERYRHQVRGEYIGQRAMIQFAADEPELLRKTVMEAKRRATMLGMNDSDNDQIPLEYEQVENFKEEFWFRPGGRGAGQDVQWQKKSFPILTKWTPTRTTTRPWGYVMPPQMAHVVPLLLDHEISVQKLIEPYSLEVEVYYATDVDNSEYFQGHYLKKITAEKRTETVEFPAGSFFVPAGQPKSNLLCYLLEPETNDNLITWSHLDAYLRAMSEEQRQRMQERAARFSNRSSSRRSGQLIPIYRLMKKAEVKGTLVEYFNTFEKNRHIR
ncbi:M14 family zinc carboxypeptidase [candidate division KSB1 bacterium]